MAKIIDGKQISSDLRVKIRELVTKQKNDSGRDIGLAVVLVGENEASKVYVKNKIVACEQVGIVSSAYYLSEDTTEKELEFLIDTLNNDENVDGILVQLPLPKHINEEKILSKVDYKKDVDGFHSMNVGNLLLGKDCLKACTPSGVIELIKSTGESIEGKNAVVIGRSNIVGKPQAVMLLKENATVTICHSKTKNIKEFTKNADIIVVAIGKAKFLTADMVKQGAIVIDVGMNRVDGKLCGDVDYESVEKVAGFITPVPGGVGPMTITMLMANTLKASLNR